jgi:hypothetical protein
MQVRIRYQRFDEASPRELVLSPEEYFDPLNPGEKLSVRSVPRLLNAREYTPFRADELRWTVVEISDGESFWRVRTQLLDGMRAFMHHTQSSDGSEEIIHSTELCPGWYHTIRTLKQPGKEWAMVVNSLMVDRAGKPWSSENFCERWSFEELKLFGDVE